MLNKFSASAKLYMLIFITAVSSIGLGLYGIIDLKRMNENTRTLYADRVLCMQQLANMRFEYITEIFPMARDVKSQVITFSEAKRRIQNAEGIINNNWHDYKQSYFTTEEKLLVDQTDVIKNQADEAIENLKSILSKGDMPALDNLVKKDFSTQPAPIIIKITRLMELQARVGKEIFNNNKEIYQDTSKKFIFLVLISLIIALPLSFYIIKNIRDLIKGILMSSHIIKESEEKYRSLLEQASDAIYLSDLKGNFIDVNESMCKITGYSKGELLQLNIADIIDPEQLKADLVTWDQNLREGSIIRERRFAGKGGNIFEVECNVKRIANNQVLVIARDITDRKRLEAGVRNAELKFRTLAEKSMVGVYIAQKELFTYVNPRFAEIFGYSPHELINTQASTIDTLISKEDQAIVREKIRARFSGEEENSHYTVRGKKKDGTLIFVEFYGSRVKIDGEPTIIGTVLDITERKRAEELILREKELSETIINSLPGVFYLQSETGEYLLWNKNLEKVTGYTRDEIVKLTTGDLIVEEDLEKVGNTVKSIFLNGYATVEAKAKMKDGSRIPFLLTGIPIMYENQLCLLGTGIDISARIKAEEELRHSEHKYKLLFESNPLPLWMVAKDDMSIIAVNEVAANLYGYSKDELLHTSVEKMRPTEDRGQQLESYQKEATRATDFGVIKHVKKDGTVIFVNIISQDIIFDQRLVRLSLTNDVTEKLKADELLKKSEANLKTIMDTTDTAYTLLDKKLTVMAFNQTAEKFVKSQYNHTPAKGDRLPDYFPKERFPQFLEQTGKALNGSNISYEINYPQRDGSLTWYYVRLFPITNDKKEIFGLMLALSDITERKNAEESLKAAYTKIQDHITSIMDMAWKQSHLIRSPLANLKGLASMLKDDPSDADVLGFIQDELDRMDTIIIEMAEDASRQEL